MMATSDEILFEGQVSKIEDSTDGKVGWVEFHGARILVNLALLPAIRVGDTVLVQGRFALSTVEGEHEIRG